MAPTTAYIGIGTNLGDRAGNIRTAVDMLGSSEGVRHLRLSSIKETLPLGGLDQPCYLNAVAEIETSLNAFELLTVLQAIENKLGRVRTGPMSSRTIDLDLLLFGKELIDTASLKIPHPQIHLRSFVLDGLVELEPGLVHPLLGKSVSELSGRLNGQNYIINPARPQLISIAGNIGAGKTTLAKGLNQVLGASLILEAYDTNPFLPKLYAGQKELALDCQLYFLVTRVEQLSQSAFKPGQLAVTDYVFEKEHIYANRLLDKQQYDLYCYINRLASPSVIDPVLLIWLQDSPQHCLERIHHRNRPYEQKIKTEFLDGLAQDYDKLMSHWTKCPVITVKNSDYDFRDIGQVKEFSSQVKYYIAL
jgi:2-amino-4-hydroxy-6-hydroxymethyldihydropteridine diphosphokinase